ncbi:MAG TPA: nucleotidyltransferase family protein [Thermomicrobiales bacterium]|nr:nucleotidyltransferase family protein [Thermomicrobiales bacterium]
MISGVILAAGSSTRLGRPKQLLVLHGEPLLRHVVRNAIASNLDDVVLVLGCDAEHIADAIGEWGQRVVINPDYADGQSTSLRHGLANIDPQAEAVLFLLGDQPGVTPAIINAVLARFRETGGPIVAPTYGGTRGNPILFSRQFFPDLARITGDQGARAIVRAHQNDVVTVPVSDGQPPQDVDTDADYAALLTSM